MDPETTTNERLRFLARHAVADEERARTLDAFTLRIARGWMRAESERPDRISEQTYEFLKGQVRAVIGTPFVLGQVYYARDHDVPYAALVDAPDAEILEWLERFRAACPPPTPPVEN